MSHSKMSRKFIAIAIIVSEENGHISYAKDSELFSKRTEQQLEQFLNKMFNQIK